MTTLVTPLVPPIVLLGPPGAGKSCVGPLLAEALGFSFIDLDVAVGVHHLVDEGLASFRVREHLALIDAAQGAVVVAAGAGIADTGPARRTLSRCLCLTIDIDVDTALLRLAAMPPASRPWLSTDPEQRRHEWTQREEHRPALRRGLSLRIVDGRPTPAIVALGLSALVKSHVIKAEVHNDVDESLLLGPGFVIADSAVAAALERCDLVVTVAEGKNLAQVERIVSALAAAGAKRDDLVIAVGGGALLDVVGLAASLFHRGVNWRAVPTTLLAMVDASLGGKTAADVVVDGVVVRNALGTIHPPSSSCVWRGFLKTLSAAEWRQGRAEMLKHSLLCADEGIDDHDDDDDDDVTAAAIAYSRGVKRFVVERDPRDQHFRQALNLGHTFAHAFEARFHIPHGDAVLHGLLCMLGVSVDVVGLDPAFALRAGARIHRLGAPPLPPLSDDDVNALLQSMRRDKKRRGRLVLLQAAGVPVLAVVDEFAVRSAFAQLR